MRQIPALATVHDLTQGFREMVCQRQNHQLDAWLATCDNSGIEQFQRFANSIRQDLEAVRNALGTQWSNGQTEGQINKLKLLKRQMYGRANFDLLRQMVLYGA